MSISDSSSASGQRVVNQSATKQQHFSGQALPDQYSEQHLVASAVYDQKNNDQKNNYVGMVVSVYHEAGDRISLLVQEEELHVGSSKIRIVGDAILRVDQQQKKVFVDLETYPPSSVQVEALPLWQEQVVVNRTRRKVGEVSVRKVVDVETIAIPVRKEKLVVENVVDGAILAQVDLLNSDVNHLFSTEQFPTEQFPTEVSPDLGHKNAHNAHVVQGQLVEFRDALDFVEAIYQTPDHGFIKGKFCLTLMKAKKTEVMTQVYESIDTALRMLRAMTSDLTLACQAIHMEIWVSDRNQATIYQNWLSRDRQLL